MYIDSSFHNKLHELHVKPFDWTTNNCGIFVGHMLEHMYSKDFLSSYLDKCIDETSSMQIISDAGGWDNILASAGFEKRTDDTIHVGDVVLAENGIGIWDGSKGLFAGRAFRRRDNIASTYFYKE